MSAPSIQDASNQTDDIDALREQIIFLKAENERLQRLVSAQARLLTNPNLTDKQRAIGYSLVTQAAAKRSRGDVGADGHVRVSAAEVSGDYRTRPAKGEPLALVNPDGIRPLAKRSDVRPIVSGLRDAGVLAVTFEPVVRQHASGDSYSDTDLVIEIDDPVDAIARLADERPAKVRKPYTRQEPCIHCGEVHPRRVVTTSSTYCEGCGGQVDARETIVTLAVPAADDPEATMDERADLERRIVAAPPSTIFLDPRTHDHEDDRLPASGGRTFGPKAIGFDIPPRVRMIP